MTRAVGIDEYTSRRAGVVGRDRAFLASHLLQNPEDALSRVTHPNGCRRLGHTAEPPSIELVDLRQQPLWRQVGIADTVCRTGQHQLFRVALLVTPAKGPRDHDRG